MKDEFFFSHKDQRGTFSPSCLKGVKIFTAPSACSLSNENTHYQFSFALCQSITIFILKHLNNSLKTILLTTSNSQGRQSDIEGAPCDLTVRGNTASHLVGDHVLCHVGVLGEDEDISDSDASAGHANNTRFYVGALFCEDTV